MSVSLFIIDHLMGKCHLMLIQCQEELAKQDLEAQERFEEQQREIAYQNYLLDRRLDEIDWAHPNSVDHSIPTGDAALDAESEELEYCSEMDDCLIPCDESDNDDILAVIDFTEEINLNDMYYEADE